MANTIQNNTVVAGSKVVVIQYNLVSDGTQETASVVYDSSAIAALVGDTDTLNCSIIKVTYATSVSSTATKIDLLFDATTDVPAVAIPLNNGGELCFDGGLINKAGAGKTGDIVITTLGLSAGDSITLELKIRRKQ